MRKVHLTTKFKLPKVRLTTKFKLPKVGLTTKFAAKSLNFIGIFGVNNREKETISIIEKRR